ATRTQKLSMLPRDQIPKLPLRPTYAVPDRPWMETTYRELRSPPGWLRGRLASVRVLKVLSWRRQPKDRWWPCPSRQCAARGYRERVARDRCLTFSLLTFRKNSTACAAIASDEPSKQWLDGHPRYDSTQRALPFLSEITNDTGHPCFQPSSNVPRPFLFP